MPSTGSSNWPLSDLPWVRLVQSPKADECLFHYLAMGKGKRELEDGTLKEI